MSDATLDSVDAVIAALGGSAAVRRLTGQSPQALHNWRKAGRFSATTHAVMKNALGDIGRDADDKLWRQFLNGHAPHETDVEEVR